MKKNLFLLICFLTVSFVSFAQFSRNRLIVGGNLEFQKMKDDDYIADENKKTTFIFSPSIGIFYRDNRAAGVRFHHHSSGINGGGVFLRQYKSLGKSFFLFAEENLMALFQKRTSYSTTLQTPEKVKSLSISASFIPGLAYAVNQKIVFELALPRLITIGYERFRYNTEIFTPAQSYTENNTYVSAGFQENPLGNLSFGMKMLLN